jgi:TP901 family phage tail tape measure protein
MSNYNLGTASGKIEIDGSSAAKGFNVAKLAANGFFGVIQNKVDSVKRLGTALTAAGVAGSAGMALAIKTAAGFQKELSNLKAVSGATAEEMDLIREKALQLGTDTVFSANESAQAMTELVKAGVPLEGVLNGAADAAVALASAGEISLTQAAEISANAMNQFGLSAEELPRVADLIAGAANASAIEVGDFGTSLSQVGAVASITGLSFDDLAVAIAQMGQAGIKGSDAGTSLKTFLTNLIPTTDRQIDKFEELKLISFDTGKAMQILASKGVKPLGDSQKVLEKQLRDVAAKMVGAKKGSAEAEDAYQKLAKQTGLMRNQFFDAEGKIKSMAEIQEVLANATKGMSEEQKLATLELMFGSDAIRAAAIMSKDGAKGFNDMANAMAGVTAADVAATKMDNLEGSLEELSGSLETARIIIGSVFLPALQKMAEFATKVVNVFNNLPGPVQTAIGLIIGLGSAMSLTLGIGIKLAFWLGPMLLQMAGFRILGFIIGLFKTFATTLWTTRSAMAAYNATSAVMITTTKRTIKMMKIMQSVAKGMAAAWALMSGPWGWAILAIAAVVAGAVALYKNWEPFRNFVDGIVKSVQDLASTFMDVLKPAFDEMVKAVEGDAMEVWKTLSDMWTNEIVPAIEEMRTALQNDLLPALQDLWKEVGPLVMQLLKLAGALELSRIMGFVKLATFLMSTVIPILSDMYKTHLVQIINGFKNVSAFIQGTVIPVFQSIWDVVSTVMNTITSVILTAWNFIHETVIPILQSIWETISSVFSTIVEIISIAVQIVYEIIVGVWGLIEPLVSLIFQGVLSVIQFVWGLITGIISGVVNAVWGIIQSVWGAISPYVSAVFNAVKGVVETVWNAIYGVVGPVVEKVWSIIQSVWGAIAGFVSGVFNKVKEAIFGPINESKAAVSNGTKSVKSSMDTLREIPAKVRQVFENVRRGIQEKLNAAVAFVKGIPSKIKGAFGDAAGMLLAIGGQIIQGLINGMTNMVSAVVGKAQEIASNVKNIISSAFQIGSPSKWAYGVGNFVMQGLRNGLADGEGLVNSEVESIINNIIKQYRKQLPEVFKKTGNKKKDKANEKLAAKNRKENNRQNSLVKQAALNQITKQAVASLNEQQIALYNLQDSLQDATKNLEVARKEYDNYKNSVAESVKETGNFVNIWNSQTSSGMVPNFATIVDSLQGAIDNAEAFDIALRRINEAGLDPAIIQQLVDAGVGSAGQVAALIATMSPEEISKLNALQQKLNNVANQVGTFAADKFYGAGVQIAQGIVDGLNSQISAVISSINNITAQLAASVAAAVGADKKNNKGKNKTPAKKPAKKKKKKAVGGMISRGQDYIVGDDGMEAITAKTNSRVVSNGALLRDIMRAGSMIKPVVQNLESLSRGGRIQAGSTAPTSIDNTKNVTVEVNNYNPVAEPSSVTTKNVMTRLAVIGVAS